MAAFETKGAQWRTSSYSGTNGGQCVEIADTPDVVGIRDSKAPRDVILSFPAQGWTAFLKAAIHGSL